MKFKDLTLNITESEYRSIPCVSYSMISDYMSEGFGFLNNIGNVKESASLTFGSVLDCLLTEPELFNEKFKIMLDFRVSDKIEKIVKELVENHHANKLLLKDINYEELIELMNKYEYRGNLTSAKRFDTFYREAAEYYAALLDAYGKKVINESIFLNANSCADEIRKHSAIGWYFGKNIPGVEILYQAKFQTVLNDIDYKCMFDILVINHNDKTIQPVDLKSTLAVKEYEFVKNFKKYHYNVQARLYSRILANVIQTTEFKDYRILPFRFIFVNGENMTPLVWDYKFNLTEGDIEFDSWIDKDPEPVAQELWRYYTLRPEVPDNIEKDGINDIVQFL